MNVLDATFDDMYMERHHAERAVARRREEDTEHNH